MSQSRQRHKQPLHMSFAGCIGGLPLSGTFAHVHLRSRGLLHGWPREHALPPNLPAPRVRNIAMQLAASGR